MATAGGGGSIGAANIELGVDTSKLDAGMAAAKANVEAQTQQIEESSKVKPGGVDDPSAGLWAVKAEVEERARLADEKAKAHDADAMALAEEQRYRQALFNMRKRDLQTHTEIVAQKRAAASAESALTTETKKTAQAVKDVADEGANIAGPQGFVQQLTGDMREATRMFTAFGKIAVFKQVAMDAHALGAQIRNIVDMQLKTGTDRANEFAESVLPNEPAERAKQFQEQLDRINKDLALMADLQGSPPELMDYLKVQTYADSLEGTYMMLTGRTKKSLEEERKGIEERLRLNLQAANAIDQRNKESADQKRADDAAARTDEMRAMLEDDPRKRINERFAEQQRELNEKINAEKNEDVRQQLEDQLDILYDLQAAELKKIDDEKQAKLDAEAQVNADKAAADAERTANRLADLKEENEAAAIALIEDPRKKADAEYEARRKKIEDNIANETDANIRAELQNKLALLDQQHKVTLGNITKEENEKKAAQQRAQQDFQRAMAEQFGQLRGEINSLFNTSNVEVGINRLGSLLQVLIQKTGDR